MEIDERLSELMKKGLCCTVRESMPTFEVSFDSTLFGFVKSDNNEQRLRSPTLTLLSEDLKPLRATINKARATLRKYAISPAKGLGMWYCPGPAILPVAQTLHELVGLFPSQVQAFQRKYANGIEQVRDAWGVFLRGQPNLSPDAIETMLDAVYRALPLTPPSTKSFELKTHWLIIQSPSPEQAMHVLDSAQALGVAMGRQEIVEQITNKRNAVEIQLWEKCREVILDQLRTELTRVQHRISQGHVPTDRATHRIKNLVAGMRDANVMRDSDIDELLARVSRIQEEGAVITKADDLSDLRSMVVDTLADVMRTPVELEDMSVDRRAVSLMEDLQDEENEDTGIPLTGVAPFLPEL